MKVPGKQTRSGVTDPRGLGGPARGGCFARAVAALAMCAGVASWCRLAEAESGSIHTRFAAGMRMTIDTRWVDGAGYRPVRIRIAPTGPTTTDKTFTVEFLLRRGYWGNDQYDLRVARDLELPAGSGPVEATVLLPRCADCDQYAINVLEDGELQPALCTRWTGFDNMPTDWGECLPAVLVVGDATPDTSQLGAMLPLASYGGSQMVRRFNRGRMPLVQVANPVTNVPQELPGLVACEAADLPQRWIDYSSLDIVCLSLEQLEQLADKNPAALTAVLQWTAAGGNLWVHGVGDDWQRVGRLDELLSQRKAADPGRLADRGWRKPDKDVYLKPVQGGLSEPPWVERGYVEVVRPGGKVYVPETQVDMNAQPPIGEVPPEPHVMLREYAMGLVVAFAGGDPFPGTADQWRGVLNAMGPDRWLWYRRHGVSMVRGNEDYWNFLIPGVGRVPVVAFWLLITVFVLAIGPSNYWLLRRWGRLHLLVVTIPLGAATVTLVLFGYAFVADGLGTRVRVRSVTLLDQSRGQAACWARLSYYAGLAPRRGLTFPDDVAVLPLEYLPVPGRRQGPLWREVLWGEGDGGEEQRFTSGWLHSRTPMQLITVRSRRSRLGLELIRSATDPEKLRVKNRLGTRIRQLVIHTDDKRYYWAEDVGDGQTVALKPFTPSAQAELQQTFRENRPQMPEGVPIRYYGGDPAIAPPEQRTSRLEARMSELGRLAAGDLMLLGPKSYVAVVEKSPEVVSGVGSAREEASYHVIWGRW